jgi:hypothetical protein
MQNVAHPKETSSFIPSRTMKGGVGMTGRFSGKKQTKTWFKRKLGGEVNAVKE